MAKKYVYKFAEGRADMRELLGGKGANLAEMTNIGLPVPQGFTVTTEACTQYYADNRKIADNIQKEIFKNLADLEKLTGKKFGDKKNPLLVSVRSGARASMPGMMDTILNLGLNSQTVEGLAALTGNPRFAYDSYRRFIQMFADVVMEVPKPLFEAILDEAKHNKGVKLDTELDEQDMRQIVTKFKALYKKQLKADFPEDVNEQLILAVEAVFRSWENPRAVVYRRMNDIPSSWGTAVNVQSMVFGNMGPDCGTGVAFTRNPANGENKLYGEYLMNAQGEDVVAGIRTPSPIAELKKQNKAVYEQFEQICKTLEEHYKDMQDMEFTIEHGKLYMLQTRNGKRTARAALKIAVDMVKAGMWTEKDALLHLEPKQLDSLLHPTFEPTALKNAKPIAQGLPASPGAASGKVCFSSGEAIERAAAGEKVVLVRLETSPEDIEGMAKAQGILTVRGGMTSHAAVVARGMGACCVSGCSAVHVDEDKRYIEVSGKRYTDKDYISIDGLTGNVYGEQIPSVPASLSGDFGKIMAWADKYRALGVRTNADNPRDARQAYEFGAEGVGLCRTEHMFFEADRIMAVREMIVSKTVEERKKALEKILPMQRKDFEGIYKEMKGNPVTIRLLDPPLHEFLPHTDAEIRELAKEMGLKFGELKATVEYLHEFNPMLGHRGCRLCVTYPEIAEMQTRAIIEAAIKVKKEKGYNITPEIMVPLVGEKRELDYVRDYIVKTADEVIKKAKVDMHYKVGTMIEIPRAAITADKIAQTAEFFSFGTNDLTQMTYGFSRDDAGKFLKDYYAKKIFEQDPFARIDEDGVGKLVEMAVKLGRSTRKDLKCGICGEHGGDPATIEFCHRVGLTYVSCSPFRVPIARLAAAQANIKYPRA